MDRHLVAVEVRVERGTDERMNLDRLSFDEYRLEGLNTQSVEGRSAVQQDRVILDNFFKNVPHHRILAFDHFLCGLYRRAMTALLETVVDEGLEQLQRHLLRKTALMKLQFRTDDDDGTARIIHAFPEEVLAETSLLSLQRIGQRFQRAVVRAPQDATAAAVIEERVDGFLQHAFLIANDHIGRMELDEFFQPVVAVDDAAIQIVQVRGRKASAIQRHERPQFRRNHRNDIKDHPFRLVTGFDECFDNLETLRKLDLLLLRVLVLHLRAEFLRQLVDIHTLQKFLDRFRAHHGDELAGVFLLKLAEFLFREKLAFLQRRLTRIDGHVSFEVQNALELAQRHIEQVPDTARQALEEPDMRARTGQLDMAETLAAHFRKGDFNTALVADDSAVFHALVFSAQAFPVGHGTKNAGIEQTVFFRFECPVVDGFRLGYFAMRPRANLFWRSQTDPDTVKIGDRRRPVVRIRSNQFNYLLRRYLQRRAHRPSHRPYRLPDGI